MEAVVVDAVALGDTQHMQPLVYICGRIAGFGEDQSVMLAAEHGGLSVDGKAAGIGAEPPHTEADAAAVGLVDLVEQIIQSRMIFAPLVVCLAQRNGHGCRAVFVCCQLRLKQGDAVLLIVLHDAAGGSKACGGCAVELHGKGDVFVLRVRICLDVIHIDIREHFQRHLTGDAVPVGLGVRRGEVTAFGGIAGVLHQNQNFHQRFCYISGDVIDMGCAQTVTAADTLAVDPEGGHPGAF